MEVRKEQKEQVERLLHRIKYRQYQAVIQLKSHDFERLHETMTKISGSCRKIRLAMIERKKTGKRKPANPGRKFRTSRVRLKK
ncbi:MAG TPA: hypothetical protein VNW99_08555 [Cytophagaceae bacterium]|jgi:hypothetical protein|nr:hypothetical protein [Cytophagaceae bacterium]